LSTRPKILRRGNSQSNRSSLTPVACLDFKPNKCANYEKCSTIDFWEGLDKIIQEYVDGTTLEELAERHISKNASDFSI
jgi:DNA-binding IscR family transcriptional regulator